MKYINGKYRSGEYITLLHSDLSISYSRATKLFEMIGYLTHECASCLMLLAFFNFRTKRDQSSSAKCRFNGICCPRQRACTLFCGHSRAFCANSHHVCSHTVGWVVHTLKYGQKQKSPASAELHIYKHIIKYVHWKPNKSMKRSEVLQKVFACLFSAK